MLSSQGLTVLAQLETLDGEETALLLRELLIGYNNGRSSSVDVELTKRVSDSMYYTLNAGLRVGQDKGSVKELYELGKERLQRTVYKAETLWRKACSTRVAFGTIAYYDTIEEGIPPFFSQYDLNYFAHETPCNIDHLLATTDGDEETGVLYIEHYLRCVCLENDFLSRFPLQKVRPLLSRYSDYYRIHYKHLLLSLFGLLFEHSLFCVLCGRPANDLLLERQTVEGTHRLLAALPPQELQTEYSGAVESLCGQLGIEDGELTDYVRRYGAHFFPTLSDLLATDNLQSAILWQAQKEAPAFTLEQGGRLTDLQLQGLCQQVMDCDDVERKFAMIRAATSSMRDFIDVMAAGCLFGDEYDRLFQGMDVLELAVLCQEIFGEAHPLGDSDTDWKQSLLTAIQAKRTPNNS